MQLTNSARAICKLHLSEYFKGDHVVFRRNRCRISGRQQNINGGRYKIDCLLTAIEEGGGAYILHNLMRRSGKFYRDITKGNV